MIGAVHRDSRKTSAPTLRGVVERERLYELLAAGDGPVSWVAAAPGAGKTTLAASFAQARASRLLWYQVDATDTDPATLFHFLRAAALRAGLARAARLPLLPTEGAADLATFATQFFRQLFALLPAASVLVLDDFQAAQGSPFETVVRAGFEQLPAGIGALVLSHAEPPPAFARLTANRTIRVVDAHALGFTRAESDQLVRGRLAADEHLLAELHERSAGWAAGLVLMLDHLGRARVGGLPTPAESQQAVFDYFAGEILAGLAPPQQRALMLGALLPRVTPRLAEATCGGSDLAALLERLCRRHLFVERQRGAEAAYRFHPLFKTFLNARAAEWLPAAERVEAAQRAALLLEADGQPEEAIGLHLASADGAAAARLILGQAQRLVREGRWRTLLDWIAALPAEVRAAEPWLDYWAGACQVWADPQRGWRTLSHVGQRLRAGGDLSGQILAAGACSRAGLLGADWSLLDPLIAELETLLAADTAAIQPEVLLTGCTRLLYAAFARQPQHPGLPGWAERSIALLERQADPNERLLAGFALLFYFTWTGQTSQGEQVVRLLAPIADAPQLGPVARAYWLWAQANHQLCCGAPEQALRVIDQALALAQGNGLAVAAVIRRHRIAHLLTVGRLEPAAAELDALAAAPHVEPYLELRAWLAWRRGQTELALDLAGEALALAERRGRSFYALLDRVLLAAICAESGRSDQALDHLARYRAATLGMPGEFAPFQAALVEAGIALARGDRAACHEPLRRALAIGSRQRYRSCWGWNPALVVPLLEEALEQGLSTGYAAELIRIHRLTPRARDGAHWPWPVRIRTLGRFEVSIDGVPLRFDGKAQRKPLELLKMLAVAGDHALAVDRLIDQLWQDVEVGGRKAFDITVHRLRKLLAADAAVEVADRSAALDPTRVWVDLWALERLLAPLQALVPGSAAAARLAEAAPAVLDLLRGPLLPGESDSAWLLPARHRLTGRFQSFAERLGEHWELEGQWARAGLLYQRVIELDPLAESFYRRQMLCLHRQGRRAEALDLFRRCRQMLAVTLGVAPGGETEALYRSLVGA